MSRVIHIVKMRATNDLVIYLVDNGTKSRLLQTPRLRIQALIHLGSKSTIYSNGGNYCVGRPQIRTAAVNRSTVESGWVYNA